MANINFLCNGSPKFKAGDKVHQAKPGFNEMPKEFTKDPYYELCRKSDIIKDFVAAPSDKDQEKFQKQVQSERERADKAEAELKALKEQIEKGKGNEQGEQIRT